MCQLITYKYSCGHTASTIFRCSQPAELARSDTRLETSIDGLASRQRDMTGADIGQPLAMNRLPAISDIDELCDECTKTTDDGAQSADIHAYMDSMGLEPTESEIANIITDEFLMDMSELFDNNTDELERIDVPTWSLPGSRRGPLLPIEDMNHRSQPDAINNQNPNIRLLR